jgi:hypothetical protein
MVIAFIMIDSPPILAPRQSCHGSRPRRHQQKMLFNKNAHRAAPFQIPDAAESRTVSPPMKKAGGRNYPCRRPSSSVVSMCGHDRPNEW